MMLELQERVTELENWKDGKGLIICGAGNTFCSGSDLNAVKAISNSQASSDRRTLEKNELSSFLRSLSNGGVSLWLCCNCTCKSQNGAFHGWKIAGSPFNPQLVYYGNGFITLNSCINILLAFSLKKKKVSFSEHYMVNWHIKKCPSVVSPSKAGRSNHFSYILGPKTNLSSMAAIIRTFQFCQQSIWTSIQRK